LKAAKKAMVLHEYGKDLYPWEASKHLINESIYSEEQACVLVLLLQAPGLIKTKWDIRISILTR
jgi:hypothetical protein